MIINILSTEYIVVLCKNFKDVDPANKCDPDAQAFGTINYINHEIRIWDCENKKEIFKTLLHELIHAILGSLAFDRLNSNECFVEQLTNVLADTLLRNDLVNTNIFEQG